MIEDGLNLVKTLSWNEVFSIWRDGEASLPRWIEHYKQRGFGSWDEWRMHSIKNLPLENLPWALFEVTAPDKTIPSFLGGPFRAWITKYYHDANTMPFSGLAKKEDIRNSPLIQEIISNFPKETYLIGLRTKTGIVIGEGMHRCCAFAVAVEEKKLINSKIFIALADYDGVLPQLGSADSPT